MLTLTHPPHTPPVVPTADVVIPTYNDGRLLERAVRSALALPCIERVIVVDDGSDQQATLDGLRPAERLRVTLLRQANAGPSAARNRGLREVRAEYCVFLDADDELLPRIAEAVAFAHRHGHAAVVSSRHERRPDGTIRARDVPPEWAGRALPHPGDVFRPMFMFGLPGVVIHRRLIDAGLTFDESIRHGQDRDFLRRAGDLGAIGICPAAVVLYTVHKDGQNVSGHRHALARTRDFLRVVERWRDDHTDPYFAEAAAWRMNEIARHGAAREAWDLLRSACIGFGWRVPLKARVRWAVRRALGRVA